MKIIHSVSQKARAKSFKDTVIYRAHVIGKKAVKVEIADDEASNLRPGLGYIKHIPVINELARGIGHAD